MDLDGPALIQCQREIEAKYKVRVQNFTVDLEDEIQRTDLISKLVTQNKKLNVLVNCAALVGTSNLSGWNENFENQSISTWRRALEVNLTAVFQLCQGLYPTMKKSAGASIINIGSIYGALGPDWRLYKDLNMANPAAYAASKGGLIQLTRWLATTLAPDVRVNAVSPGGIERNQNKEFIARYLSKTPLGRMATEQDLQGVLVFLASDLSSYVTGQNITVDGGWSIW